MLDTRKQIVAALKTISNNVYYELAVGTPTFPCITYKLLNDKVNAKGDTLVYSDVAYQIKVWATDLTDIASLTTSIDSTLRVLGLERTMYNEMVVDNVIQSTMHYQGLSLELIGGNN